MRPRYGGGIALNEGWRLAPAAIQLRLCHMPNLTKAFRYILLLLAMAASSPASAWQGTLQQRVEAVLAAAPPGARFGLLVTAQDGSELIAINPDGRFIPASNTKLLTTASAFATLIGIDQPDASAGASIRLALGSRGAPDVILIGGGDARLSSAADCAVNCLATLADAVAARTRRVRNVVGDDSLFEDQRWSPGMSWNNIHTRSGTAASALTLDDNELLVRVFPSAVGQRPSLDLLPYYRIVNEAVTVAEGPSDVEFARLPGSQVVRVTGRIAIGAEPVLLRLAIDDPAHYAAWRLKSMLEARGVRVRGAVAARHRAAGVLTAPLPEAPALARAIPPPLAEDLARINKVSQNLHAELVLRRLGLAAGRGSIEGGMTAIASMLERAGVPRTGWDLSDGSGMSTYNRLSPRAVVALLRWADAQPWGEAWRATFPVAGLDGTLANRFRGSPLERRLFAKTGTLNATNALSGQMIARSGRTLFFSFFANDVPGGGGVTATMDEALERIAAEN
jgi:D-alanyl-D-alanine carboxypeptidase/D-alanyl-D-alanine-endopeptidase (penicillin-binding protein 4)